MKSMVNRLSLSALMKTAEASLGFRETNVLAGAMTGRHHTGAGDQYSHTHADVVATMADNTVTVENALGVHILQKS